MVRVERDVAFINKIANDADVRPFIRPDGEAMDFSAIEGKRNAEIGGVILSNGEDAVAIFEITAEDCFQAHTMFAPTCRGRKAIDAAKEMVAWMFAHGARIVWGATPHENKRAIMFNHLIGAREVARDDTHVIFEMKAA